MRRGDVWWVEAPDEEPRPYVILTRDEAIDGLEKLVAAPATRTVRGIVSEVQVGPADGMRVESIVSLDNIAVVPKEFMRRRVTALEPDKMAAICRALNKATGC